MTRFLAVILICGSTALAQNSGVGVTHADDRVPDYSPATTADRASWVIRGTIGPANLAAGVVTAGWGTLMNSPREYGSHWDGYGKRYGLRFANGSTGRTIEAGLGSLWGEDPRYFRADGQPIKSRVTHVLKMTFMSTDQDGYAMPAYARYIAVPANSFLTNAWRADSHATTSSALERVPIGFVDRLLGNAFAEFWPDVKRHVFKSKGH